MKTTGDEEGIGLVTKNGHHHIDARARKQGGRGESSERCACLSSRRTLAFVLIASFLLVVAWLIADTIQTRNAISDREKNEWDVDIDGSKESLLNEDDTVGTDDTGDDDDDENDAIDEGETNVANLVSTSNLGEEQEESTSTSSSEESHDDSPVNLGEGKLPNEFLDDGGEEEGVEFSHSAPRTSRLPYNEMDKTRRYMIYSPSGGMTNQELELTNAMHMAKILGRTLYFPMIGRHSNLVTGYNALRKVDLFPADRLFDFDIMSKYCRVVAINSTLKGFIKTFTKNVGGSQIRYLLTEIGYPAEAIAHQLKNVKTMLVFFSGNAMWGRWFPMSVRKETRRHIAYSPYLRQMSMKIAQASLGSKFYAIHGRLGDEAYRWGHEDAGGAFVRAPEFHRWNKSLKCYLASDDPHNHFFKPLRDKINVVSIRDLSSKSLDEFGKLFPGTKVRSDMMGILDKLICVQALEFIGSSFSTFSNDILVMRGNFKYTFPELWMAKKNGTAKSGR